MLNPPERLSAHQVSQLLGKISKIWLVTLEPYMRGLCMSNFSPLASMVWEEQEEVTDGRMAKGCHAIIYIYIYIYIARLHRNKFA